MANVTQKSDAAMVKVAFMMYRSWGFQDVVGELFDGMTSAEGTMVYLWDFGWGMAITVFNLSKGSMLKQDDNDASTRNLIAF